MRPALACPILAIALGLPAALASCNQTDPALSLPCSERPDAGVVMGIGQFSYVELGTNQGPFIDSDLQQGDYVWLGIGCQGLGPVVTLDYGIVDNDSGADLSKVTGERLPLSYQGGYPPDVLPGLQAYFTLPAAGYTIAEQLVGDSVTVWADVSDSCHAEPVHGELSTTLEGYDFSACPSCLDQECHVELAACDAECHAIQGCLDAYCVNLSASESNDEALCQAYCQGLHPTGKDAHVAVVTCVQDMARGGLCATETCFDNPVDGGAPPQFCYDASPCFPYPIDYQHCVDQVDDPTVLGGNGCNPAFQACKAESDCAAYQTCNDTCGSWPACQACAAAHPAGEALFESYQRCVEDTCLAQGWILHIFSDRKPPRQNRPIEKWKAPTSSQKRRFRLKP
jgi:hypothetical protein